MSQVWIAFVVLATSLIRQFCSDTVDEVADEDPSSVVCSTSACGHVFGVYPVGMENDGSRTACPDCGATERTVLKTLTSTVRLSESLGYAAHPPGPKTNIRRFAWGFSGWEHCVSLGRLVWKVSGFDKRANRRYEHIEDPETGTVLHHYDKPLTDHQGHGSAKVTKPKKL